MKDGGEKKKKEGLGKVEEEEITSKPQMYKHLIVRGAGGGRGGGTVTLNPI